MKVLIDTHVLIWWDSDPDRLSAKAREVLCGQQSVVHVSVVSLWELQIKAALGKVALSLPLRDLVREQQERNGVELVGVRAEHVFAVGSLPAHHKDPFDRMLVAQALIEGFTIVSCDPMVARYAVPVLW